MVDIGMDSIGSTPKTSALMTPSVKAIQKLSDTLKIMKISIKDLPRFSGKPLEDCEEWLLRYEAVCNVYNLTDAENLNYVLAVLLQNAFLSVHFVY